MLDVFSLIFVEDTKISFRHEFVAPLTVNLQKILEMVSEFTAHLVSIWFHNHKVFSSSHVTYGQEYLVWIWSLICEFVTGLPKKLLKKLLKFKCFVRVLPEFTYRRSRAKVFCKKNVLRNFAKFTGKHLCQSLFFKELTGLRPATVLKKKLWHRCFHVNLAKFLRTPFLTEHLRWLLLSLLFRE